MWIVGGSELERIWHDHSLLSFTVSLQTLTSCAFLQAALRRLAAGCPDSIEAADQQQLIKPRLVDSFLLCSNMEESFV